MNFTNMLRIAAIGLALTLGTSAAYAQTKGTPQTHHCKLPDGSMDMKKTKKQCLAAKGTWTKDADAGVTPVASAPATTPATAPAAPAQ